MLEQMPQRQASPSTGFWKVIPLLWQKWAKVVQVDDVKLPNPAAQMLIVTIRNEWSCRLFSTLAPIAVALQYHIVHITVMDRTLDMNEMLFQ